MDTLITIQSCNVKYGEAHISEDCSKNRKSPATFALCSEDHTANFNGCRVYQTVLKQQQINYTNSQNNTLRPIDNSSESLPDNPFQ